MTTDRERRAADKFSINKNRQEPMTTDRERELVAALRQVATLGSNPTSIFGEAADKIEALERENEALRAIPSQGYAAAMARRQDRIAELERENEALQATISDMKRDLMEQLEKANSPVWDKGNG